MNFNNVNNNYQTKNINFGHKLPYNKEKLLANGIKTKNPSEYDDYVNALREYENAKCDVTPIIDEYLPKIREYGEPAYEMFLKKCSELGIPQKVCGHKTESVVKQVKQEQNSWQRFIGSKPKYKDVYKIEKIPIYDYDRAEAAKMDLNIVHNDYNDRTSDVRYRNFSIRNKKLQYRVSAFAISPSVYKKRGKLFFDYPDDYNALPANMKIDPFSSAETIREFIGKVDSTFKNKIKSKFQAIIDKFEKERAQDIARQRKAMITAGF